MPSLNRVFLIGHQTRNPDLRYTPKGTAVAQLGLAINRMCHDESGEKREETVFVGQLGDKFRNAKEVTGQFAPGRTEHGTN
jgi:single stranded DNA-binding protein